MRFPILQVNSDKINAPAYSTLDGYEGVYVPDDSGRKYYSLLKDQAMPFTSSSSLILTVILTLIIATGSTAS